MSVPGAESKQTPVRAPWRDLVLATLQRAHKALAAACPAVAALDPLLLSLSEPPRLRRLLGIFRPQRAVGAAELKPGAKGGERRQQADEDEDAPELPAVLGGTRLLKPMLKPGLPMSRQNVVKPWLGTRKGAPITRYEPTARDPQPSEEEQQQAAKDRALELKIAVKALKAAKLDSPLAVVKELGCAFYRELAVPSAHTLFLAAALATWLCSPSSPAR